MKWLLRLVLFAAVSIGFTVWRFQQTGVDLNDPSVRALLSTSTSLKSHPNPYPSVYPDSDDIPSRFPPPHVLNSIQLPALEVVRSQLQQNPHDTPQAATQLANQLAPHMELALDHPEYAVQVIRKLKECAGSETVSHGMRAQCVVNIARLAARHEGVLKQEFENLKAHLPKPVLGIVEAMGY